MSRILLIGIISVLLVLFVVVLSYFGISKKARTTMNATSQLLLSAFPEIYQHMTIPYLRSRSYTSKLGALEQISDNGSYTSYLTSYQSDGLNINALVTKPTGEKPNGGWPAVIFVHGYIPPTQYVTTEKYIAYVDSLARNGFVVFKIDLRGHGKSEGKAGGGYYGSDYVVDTLNAYAAMQSADFVNKDAVGMWGHSMAGNTLLRSAVIKQTIPAIVIWAGAVYSYEDQLKYGLNDTSYRPPVEVTQRTNLRRQLLEKVGSPSASSPFWSQVAPTNYLSDIKGAIEIHHAQDDDVVNIGYSRDLVALLDKTSIPHEYYEYSTGGHNITDPSFGTAMERTVEFYKKYLK